MSDQRDFMDALERELSTRVRAFDAAEKDSVMEKATTAMWSFLGDNPVLDIHHAMSNRMVDRKTFWLAATFFIEGYTKACTTKLTGEQHG